MWTHADEGAKSEFFLNTFLTMKADDSADCAVQGTGLRLLFLFWDFHMVNAFEKTRIFAGVSFNGPESKGWTRSKQEQL